MCFLKVRNRIFKRYLKWIRHLKFTGCPGNTCLLAVCDHELNYDLKIIIKIKYNLIVILLLIIIIITFHSTSVIDNKSCDRLI
jgi:hypothetical protein